MVMRADVLGAAIDAASTRNPQAPRLYLSPRGTPLTQERVRSLAAGPGVLLLAGRFEGIDERVIEARGLAEVSIGDYVLSGGELAAMVLIDAVVRLLPGVIGQAASLDRGELRGGAARIPPLHAPARMGGPPHPRRAALRRPQAHRRVAPRAGRAPHRRAPPRPRAHPPREAGRVGAARTPSKPRSTPAILDPTFPSARRRRSLSTDADDIAASPPAERHPALPAGAYDIAPRASATPAARRDWRQVQLRPRPWTVPVPAPIKRPPHEP